ncbi:TetR/AcrR family transcriptional regulator [Dactylosporangium sp. AC04546]|uniref:TetR/AcrR family transcriptional regulator n=1 Tax=Dactylosporangium sp. AC04546 TaxID=2862460 RepID=UPI001EDEFC32|nr:TetR/AcrR family transcriptional regulator [Dactylosporangium sp. AC04546]WVK86136.1 TetR/AcrR family transcriptional regulator [Dactylosporangium sp. AC04546]
MNRREPPLLPLVGQPPAERADAARNRQRLVEAAQRIVAAKGVQGLALDEVAKEAGVGVGTAYRRFGDVSGLAYTLMEGHEFRFQEAFLSGPPPLGPGAPAAERVRAFVHGLLDLQWEQWDLRLLAVTKAPEGYGSGPYNAYHLHLRTLLNELVTDADYWAGALLALLQPAVLDHQQRVLGIGPDRIRAGLDAVLDRLLRQPSGPAA